MKQTSRQFFDGPNKRWFELDEFVAEFGLHAVLQTLPERLGQFGLSRFASNDCAQLVVEVDSFVTIGTVVEVPGELLAVDGHELTREVRVHIGQELTAIDGGMGLL